MKTPPYVTIKKEIGETPLEALTRARKKYGIPENVPLAYAGRLDPLASGMLLILIGDTCKKQKQFHGYDKSYDFEILFGWSSDSGDILGIPTRHQSLQTTEQELQKLAWKTPRTLTLPYPIFSSKTVKGKPLFLWTLEGRLPEIEIPSATTVVYSCTYRKQKKISSDELLSLIHKRINSLTHVTEDSKKLGADFRRTEILKAWETCLRSDSRQYSVATYRAVVSSGTYIRSLIPYLAHSIGTEGLALSIHRTHIGTFLSLPFIGGVWTKKF